MTPIFYLICSAYHFTSWTSFFDDADGMAWYTSALLSDIVDVSVKSKFVKKQSDLDVPFRSYVRVLS